MSSTQCPCGRYCDSGSLQEVNGQMVCPKCFSDWQLEDKEE